MARQPSETTQKLRSAAVLAYRDGDQAPRLVAKGRGLMADEIIRRAREAGIYVHESRELVSLLMQIDLDRHIPQQLYVAVAELLAWLHRIESGRQAGMPPPAQGTLPCPN
jgi:flagellar biosynthesis protein